jgi:anti-sigma regulatory factor (Ser/Thr protein kinase)
MVSQSSWKCSQTFPARPDQIPRSRAFIARVSNSGQPDGHFTVRAEARDGDYLWIEVEDQGGHWADRQRSPEGGRGLGIVTALADYWEVRGDATARVVCARLNWPTPVRDTTR